MKAHQALVPSALRIAVVLHTPRDAHSSVFLTSRALAGALAAAGHGTTIVTPDDFSRRCLGRWTPLVYPLAVARWIRRHRAALDLVVFHSYAGWWASASGALAGLPHVVAFHGLEPLYHRELQEESRRAGGLSWRYRLLQERFMPMALSIACRRAALVTCLNSGEREAVAARKWAPPGRVRVVPHGVPDEFTAGSREARPVRSLLFVGQWLPMKGAAYLAAAFGELAGRHRDLRLVCAGTLAGAEAVRSAFEARVRPRVVVLPRLDRDALLRCHAEADVFVFPSLYEGFGVAVLEAMASGLPVVSTPVGVAIDALRHERNALIVPRRDAGAIVNAVERLIADDALCSRLGTAARTTAHGYREADRMRELADALIGAAARAAAAPDRAPGAA
ncbi:MAG TPA: glycosyltransferase family 4 protein [Vicinamibacterales bacterium]|nr:glycosyltransferase family 4 protein [Vicinamibacterales bacterium]